MTTATQTPPRPAVVVIGYGNELRGDDQVGVEVARAIATWELPEVQALAVHQLTPELAAVLAEAERAIFVDACHSDCDAEPSLEPVEPLADAPLDAHIGDPHALLTLTRALYGRSPTSWQVLIPAASFAYGARLSPLSSRGMLTTLRFLRDLIRTLR
jgi:hydrogenase maturation protease